MLKLGLFQCFQKHRFYLKKEKVTLQPNTSQILQTCTQIIDYENKIYLIYFISIIFIVKPLENVFSTNHWISFFSILYCFTKEGIYNEHTSTSFVIDCANNIITAFLVWIHFCLRDLCCRTRGWTTRGSTRRQLLCLFVFVSGVFFCMHRGKWNTRRILSRAYSLQYQ